MRVQEERSLPSHGKRYGGSTNTKRQDIDVYCMVLTLRIMGFQGFTLQKKEGFGILRIRRSLHLQMFLKLCHPMDLNLGANKKSVGENTCWRFQ